MSYNEALDHRALWEMSLDQAKNEAEQLFPEESGAKDNWIYRQAQKLYNQRIYPNGIWL